MQRAERAWSVAGWGLLVVVSSLAWFQTGRGLAFRLGIGELASAIGLAAAALVAVTLVRWARGDAQGRALAELRCPTCSQPLATRHEHAAGSMPGRQVWSCAACGFGTIEPLTCEGCAA